VNGTPQLLGSLNSSYIWDSVYRINNSHWTLIEAYAINDSGQIVGIGSYSTGVGFDGPPTGDCDNCAFLLTRADSDVPEPSTAALGALSLAALAILRRLAA
jgi:hypothetical protein